MTALHDVITYTDLLNIHMCEWNVCTVCLAPVIYTNSQNVWRGWSVTVPCCACREYAAPTDNYQSKMD